MVTLRNTDFKSDMRLCSALNVKTKSNAVYIITKLGEYISPNLKKDEEHSLNFVLKSQHRSRRNIQYPAK